MPPTCVLSLDVEEWYQVENLRPLYPPSTWATQESRCDRSTRLYLDILREGGVAGGTLFVLGEVARRLPAMVREFSDAGFEVASHGMDHRSNFELTPDEIDANLRDSKALLEDLAGREVTGYRAPSFTISQAILERVAEAGYRYDSSLNEFSMHDRYGRLDTERMTRPAPGAYRDGSTGLLEFPVATRRVLGGTVAWGGGGYFRLYPPGVFLSGARRILADTGLFVFYLHPWELDPEQPRVRGLGAWRAFRHYNNLTKTAGRLRDFIAALKADGVRFASMRELCGELSPTHA
ncbi:MAG: DUF3473 domain-containing protein [Deltaproteobacteria bacterium]|nr:DUF3473 domain-containing protein [Deltaproteobacteria bacterium]